MNNSVFRVGRKWLGNPLLLAGIGPVILFLPNLLSGNVLFWGLPSLQFVPWQYYALQILKSGEIPLWNPLNGLGSPFLANYQLALFYPATWISLIFGWVGGISALSWTHSLLIMLHLILAGSGMVMLGRELGLSRTAQAITGISFGLCGYLVARTGFYSMIWAASWLPWMFLLTIRIKPNLSNINIKILIGLILVMTFQLLSGHAQLTYYSSLLVSLWVVFYHWTTIGWRKMVKISLLFSTCVIGAILIASIQLFPTLEFLSLSQRSNAVDFDQGLTYSFWPWRILTFFSPNMFGNPGLGTYTGYANFWEDSAYVGLPIIFLAFFTLKSVFQVRDKSGSLTMNESLTKHRTMIRFLWVVAIVGFVFALGKNTPIFLFLYDNIPTFSMFNGPTRWLIWTEFSLCLLGGIGWDGLGILKGKTRQVSKLLLVGCAAIFLGATQSLFILDESLREMSWGLVFFALGALVFFGLMLIRNGEAIREKIWRVGIVIFVLCDLLVASRGLIPVISATYINQIGEKPAPPKVAGSSDIVFIPAADEYFLKFSRFFRFDSYTPLEDWDGIFSAMLPNTNLLYGIRFANNFDPLIFNRTARWLNEINQASSDEQLAMMRHTGITLLEHLEPNDALGVTFTKNDAYPRLRWYSCATYVGSIDEAFNQTLDLIKRGDNSKVVIEGTGEEGSCEDKTFAQIVLTGETTTSLSLDVDVSQDGWLVLADASYPGWTVSIDGRLEDIYPADSLFRGVKVPEGHHQIVFNYFPRSFSTGSLTSCVSIALLGIFALIVFLRKRA